MGELFNNDAKIYREFFKEQARLLGIRVMYRYPIDMDYTLHGQDNPKGYSEPIELDIIFDQSPKLKTLKALGWVSEDPTDKPYIVQVPYDTKNLQQGCLIDLPVPEELGESRTFKVTDIQVNQIFPDSWFCKVVPQFKKRNVLKPEDYKDRSYSFLKVDNDAI